MTHLEFCAIKKFAKDLKINFPILLRPKNFTERIINLANEAAIKKIDLAIERAKLDWEIEVNKEVALHGKV